MEEALLCIYTRTPFAESTDGLLAPKSEEVFPKEKKELETF